MNTKSRLLTLLALFLMLLFLGSSASAAGPVTISQDEFRERFREYMAWLDSNTSQHGNLALKVQAMNDEEVKYLYDCFADPNAFVATTERIMAPAARVRAQTIPGIVNSWQGVTTTVLFPPAYPSGATYSAWVATLPGLDLLSDSEGDGSLANERCSTDGESGIGIAAGTLTAAAIVGDVACNTIVVVLGAGTNLPACIVAGLLHEAENANNIVASQCASQDGLVDSAEIEATYENSKIISGQVDAVANQLDAHDTDIKDALLEVMNTITENQAQSLRIEIEKALADTNDNMRLSYFYLPAAQGGLLELVRQTVLDTINANQAARAPISRARFWFAKAEVSSAKGDYKLAYDQYANAYLEVVK